MAGLKRAGEVKAAGKKMRQGRHKKGYCYEDRPVIEANAAGVDVGARQMYVAIPPDRDADSVRVYETFTQDLETMADWLIDCGVTTVAMESTGVYWIALYQILEDRGLRACLVNPRHMRNVPGRRTDWHECQWIQYLHSMGLLRSAFRPAPQVCAVRSLMRHRQELVEMACQHIQRMQKALTQMNFQVQHVISDITGVTGTAVVDAILAGKRDPEQLAKLRNDRIQVDDETFRKSLQGDWREEHLFTLRQSRKLYDCYREQIVACDQEIARRLEDFDQRVDLTQKPLPKLAGPSRKRRNKRTGDFRFDVRQYAYQLYGVDVTRIPGIQGTAISLFSEVGRDLVGQFGSAGEFSSWLGLCPDNDKTGGKVVWRGVRHVHNRAGQMFRNAANGLHRSQTPMGDYLRRMKAKLGAEAGIVAAAHKLAIIFYTLVTKQVEYEASVWAQRDQNRKQRLQQKLKRQARLLGFALVPIGDTPVPDVP